MSNVASQAQLRKEAPEELSLEVSATDINEECRCDVL